MSPASAVDVLTTTRSVRRRLDLERPVDPTIVASCIEIALQAPAARGRWLVEWLVLTDPDRRAAAAEVYRAAVAETIGAGAQDPLLADVDHLAQKLHEVPVLVLPFVRERPTPEDPYVRQVSHWASVLPAIWSFQLAARAHRLGTTLTTVHLRREHEMATALDLPRDAAQVGLLPVAHVLGGDLRPARRPPLSEVVHHDVVR